MKEDMLQNDTEEVRQMNENLQTGGENIVDVDDFVVADDTNQDDESESGLAWLVGKDGIWKIALPVAGVAFAILILIIANLSGNRNGSSEVKESFVSSAPKQEVVTEAQDAKPAEQEKDQSGEPGTERPVYEEDQGKTDLTAALIEEAEKKYQSLHDMVFGGHNRNSSLGCVTAVTGFTDREKREIGFLESDFLKDAGAFLAGQQIQTKRIIIEDRIANSSDAGVAFQGRLEGKDDYILDMVFYPDLPGEYVFLLRSIKGNERENSEQPGTEAPGQNAGQNTGQAQNNQSTASSQETTAPAVTPQNVQPVAGPQNSYDATNLSVKKIPETLLNYLDNRYEFQYSLYDWLYHHGKRDVGSASVTDYSIDGDARQAVIELHLSDGSSVTAAYDKSSNSYSFER